MLTHFPAALCLADSDQKPLYFRALSISERPGRQMLGNIEARHADPVVGHPIINVEAIGRAEVVAPIDGGRKHYVGDDPLALLR